MITIATGALVHRSTRGFTKENSRAYPPPLARKIIKEYLFQMFEYLLEGNMFTITGFAEISIVRKKRPLYRKIYLSKKPGGLATSEYDYLVIWKGRVEQYQYVFKIAPALGKKLYKHITENGTKYIHYNEENSN